MGTSDHSTAAARRCIFTVSRMSGTGLAAWRRRNQPSDRILLKRIARCVMNVKNLNLFADHPIEDFERVTKNRNHANVSSFVNEPRTVWPLAYPFQDRADASLNLGLETRIVRGGICKDFVE